MKDLVFSGVKPTGMAHLGTYIGALKQWVAIQKDHQCLFCIVDLHAITVPQEPKALRANILDVASTYLAAGIDPTRSIIFIQSEVAEHAELGWILGTIAKMGELERMTQFKDKSQKGGRERAGLGLFAYPALMAADILLYDTSAVPVGEDQMQHLEITRVIAKRFNQQFSARGGSASGGGDIFVIPQALIQKHGARIMNLQDPTKKMSKSDESTNGTIMLDDDADAIRKKIMRAVTDTSGGVSFDPEKKPAVSNLMTIYHHMSGLSLKEIEAKYEGKGYGDFKKDLADVTIAHLDPIRAKIEMYRKDPKALGKILDDGRDAAKAMAEAKMKFVRERVGLGR